MDRLPPPRIAYLPWFDRPAEKGYTFLMRHALADFGEVVRYRGIAGTWRDVHRRLDAIVVNWTDNDLVDRHTRRVALRKVAKVFARTIALRLAARRLVFVRHNVHPHAVAPGAEAAAARWVDRYERLFDVVLTHSGDDTQRPRRYCPHPLYPRVRSDHDAPRRALPERYSIAFGRIVPYKRLEALMHAFPADRTLIVMGAVGDRAYAASLAAIARPNVIFEPGLVDEAEAQSLVAGAEALLIAHAERDVVVSSSFFFAMSLGTRVHAVATPFLRWIAPRVGDSALVVADDVAALCAGIDASPANARPDAVAIEREFGDATVRAALGAALGMASRQAQAPDRSQTRASG